MIYPDIDHKWSNYDVSPDLTALSSVGELFESLAKIPAAKNTSGLHFTKETQSTFNQ